MRWRCFGKSHELAIGGAEGLELRLASRWNEGVSHFNGSETGKSIGNVQEGNSMEKSVNRRNRSK